jgi:hypothetical protein
MEGEYLANNATVYSKGKVVNVFVQSLLLIISNHSIHI